MLTLADLKFAVCEPGAQSAWTWNATEEGAQAIADRLTLECGKTYVVEPYDDFEARVNRSWLERTPLQEITPEFYDEMLNVLPPMYRTGAMGFFICEYTAGTITNQFVSHRRGDFIEPRYYVAAVDMSDRATWITPEKIAALPDAPRLAWFDRKEGETA
jgi:hypothetical protein